MTFTSTAYLFFLPLVFFSIGLYKGTQKPKTFCCLLQVMCFTAGGIPAYCLLLP